MLNISNLNVVILAGGFGTRLKNKFPDIPKALVPIQNKPFITYIMDQLDSFGLSHVTISTGYLSSKIRKRIGNRYKNIQINYSKEEMPLGTGGALKSICFSSPKENVLVLNGDSYLKFNLKNLYKAHTNNNAKVTILLKMKQKRTQFGSVNINKDNQIIEFKEKKEGLKKGLINAGIYLIKSSILKMIPNKTPCSLELDFFPNIIGRGLYGLESQDFFTDIGTPESYEKANKNLFFKIKK